MKNKIMALIIILVMMAVIPFLGVGNKVIIKYQKPKAINVKYTKADICGFVSKNFRKEYSEETIKALTVIIQSNYSANKKCRNITSDNYISKEEFLKLHGKNSFELYSKIKKAVDEVYKIEIRIHNKKVYVPYRYITKNDNSKKNSFIKNCATPWDILKKEYKSIDEKNTVSLNTINNLSQMGYTYKECLGYFIKDIDFLTATP